MLTKAFSYKIPQMRHFRQFRWQMYASSDAAQTSAIDSEKANLKTQILKDQKTIVVHEKISIPSRSDTVQSSTVSFDDIPGPISLEIINYFWKLFPVVSTQITVSAIQYVLAVGSLLSWSGNLNLYKRFFNNYGPVIRLKGPLGGDIVLVNRPEHVAEVFHNEGPYPVRSSLDSLEKYRLQHRNLHNTGPLLMFGPEWEKFRQSIEKPMPLLIEKQYHKIENASDKFLDRIDIIRNRQYEVPGNFQTEIYKWALECMCSVTLNKTLGFLDPCGLSSTSDPGILLTELMAATNAIQRCEYGLHLWQFMSTPAWKSLIKHCDAIDTVLSKYVQQVRLGIQEKKDGKEHPEVTCLLENILLKGGIMSEDALTILMDMMLIGNNAITHTIAFLLYHLAVNPRAQVKLHKEILSQQSTIGKEELSKMPYLQACIKESWRLKPPIPVLGRIMQNDVVLDNYQVPKGTYVMMLTCLPNWKEEFFEDAHKFMPERWLQEAADIEGFVSSPFGYGAKACVAKELAEIQVAVLLSKLLKRFKIEYVYGEIKCSSKLWATPKSQLRFRFANRV